MNRLDFNKIKFEHLEKLKSSGYDFSCAICGYMYKTYPNSCEECGSKKFILTEKLIKKLELGL